MKSLFDEVSIQCSRITTLRYSTSFSLAIRLLNKEIQNSIFAIYGFVRFADEIVDTFHDYDKQVLLDRFEEDTYRAIKEGISLNPILNSFQNVVNQYDIPLDLIDTFLKSMRMDLEQHAHDQKSYEEYILGSAEVVGLMCLKVFVHGDEKEYQRLKPYAMRLGAAFQKINFLRDLQADYHALGRVYFPGISMDEFNDETKKLIEEDLRKDFEEAIIGIKLLPRNSRLGVYLAYTYYLALFRKIQNAKANRILNERVRIPNERKYSIIVGSYLKHQLNLI